MQNNNIKQSLCQDDFAMLSILHTFFDRLSYTPIKSRFLIFLIMRKAFFMFSYTCHRVEYYLCIKSFEEHHTINIPLTVFRILTVFFTYYNMTIVCRMSCKIRKNKLNIYSLEAMSLWNMALVGVSKTNTNKHLMNTWIGNKYTILHPCDLHVVPTETKE